MLNIKETLLVLSNT